MVLGNIYVGRRTNTSEDCVSRKGRTNHWGTVMSPPNPNLVVYLKVTVHHNLHSE